MPGNLPIAVGHKCFPKEGSQNNDHEMCPWTIDNQAFYMGKSNQVMWPILIKMIYSPKNCNPKNRRLPRLSECECHVHQTWEDFWLETKHLCGLTQCYSLMQQPFNYVHLWYICGPEEPKSMSFYVSIPEWMWQRRPNESFASSKLQGGIGDNVCGLNSVYSISELFVSKWLIMVSLITVGDLLSWSKLVKLSQGSMLVTIAQVTNDQSKRPTVTHF